MWKVFNFVAKWIPIQYCFCVFFFNFDWIDLCLLKFLHQTVAIGSSYFSFVKKSEKLIFYVSNVQCNTMQYNTSLAIYTYYSTYT